MTADLEEGAEMDDETLRRGQKVQAAAGKLGLQADSYVENE